MILCGKENVSLFSYKQILIICWLLLSAIFAVLPAVVQAQAFCVRKSGAELRVEPKSSAPVSWKVGKFMPLQGAGKSKNGYLLVLDLDGEEHWVKIRDVTQKTKCLVVRVKSAKIRTGPGKEFPQAMIASFDKYSPFKVLGGQDGWSQIEDDTGSTGWVNLDHVWQPVNYRLRMTFENEQE